MPQKLRVFVSYAHTDLPLVARIVEALEGNGLEPMWDRAIRPSGGFGEEIRSFIAHAHVFMPVITPESNGRGWVHQEIGYALGLNVPVAPVCLGHLPDAMMQGLQAIVVTPESDLKSVFRAKVFDRITNHADSQAHYACARLPDDRARMLAEYARSVRAIDAFGHVRQIGGLSSFHIPNVPVDNPEWKHRFGLHHRTEGHCQLLLAEHKALVEHALHAGCSLIVNPDLDFEPLGPGVRSIRIWELILFLESMPDDKVRVVFDRNLESQSKHIVGDWFLAETLTVDVKSGHRQTIFTRHATTIRQRVQDFDELFDDLLGRSLNEACESRKSVIAALKSLPRVDAKPPEWMVRRTRPH